MAATPAIESATVEAAPNETAEPIQIERDLERGPASDRALLPSLTVSNDLEVVTQCAPSSCASSVGVTSSKALVAKRLDSSTEDGATGDEEDEDDDIEAAKTAHRRKDANGDAKRSAYATLGNTGPPKTSTEFYKLWALSLPIVFTYVLEFLPGVTSIILVGRMDSPLTKEYVGGATLSSMFIYLSGEAPGFGLATALDTLCSQAYGAGKPQRIGVSFQTGVLVLSAVLVPVFWLNWYSGHFMTLMQQPDDVAVLAGQFSRCLLPGLPFLFLYELLKKVLQAQNIVAPMVWIAILSNIVNVVLGIFLTWYTPLGFQGAAIARSVSNLVLPLATVPYFIWHPENFHVWWPGWQPRAALEHVGVFLSLGIPGMFMLVLEWLSYEIMAVFAGLLPNSVVAISVHSVLSNVANIAFHFFIGVGVATNVLVGNYVGSGQKDHAKLVSSLGLVVSISIAVGLVITITMTHRLLPTMFINDDESIELASIAVLYLIPFELLDAANCVMQGVFRGTGRQTFAAVVNLVCYFVIGLPSGFLFAFKFRMGVEGFWLALSLGYLCSVGVSLWKIWTTNWDAMVEQANERTVA